jgi:hypothetical protein
MDKARLSSYILGNCLTVSYHKISKLEKWFQKSLVFFCFFGLLEKHKVSTKYITLIKDMYRDVVTFVRTCDGDTSDFPIKIGLHQRSTLSPYLSAWVMDGVTRNIQGDIPWCILFADDVVLVDGSRAGVNRKLEL